MTTNSKNKCFGLGCLVAVVLLLAASGTTYKSMQVSDTTTGAAGTALNNNFTETADRIGSYVEKAGAPDVDDDINNATPAYENSVWKNSVPTPDELYWCLENTDGAAQWQKIGDMLDLVDDTTPQLGGDLDGQSYSVTTTGSARFGDLIDPQLAGHVRAKRVDIQYRATTPIPLVTFQFDDGDDSAIDLMKPVFDAQGEAACVAIITDSIGNANKLTWAEVITLENAGWEILSHTQSHPDLTGSSDEELVTELGGSKDVIEAQGLTVNNFVNPGHLTDENVRSFIRRYYRSARSTNTGSFRNLSTLNTYSLSADQADDATEQEMKDEVDIAETNNEWLIFFLHATDAADATKIGNVIDYIQGKGISIVTANQGLDLIENVYEAGDMNAGRSFSVNPAGDLRANEIHAVGSVSVWNPAAPVAHDVGIYYANADLGLRAYDGDGTDRDVVVEVGTVAFRPGDGSRRAIELGQTNHEWATVWATGMSSSFQDLTYQSARDIVLNAAVNIDVAAVGVVTIGDGGTTNYVEFSAAGDQTFVGSAGVAYGSTYGNEIDWSQASATENTWYDISDADMADGQLNNVTHDGNGQLTVTEPGRYEVLWSASVEADAINQHLEVAIAVNGTEASDGRNHIETFGTSRQQAASGVAILNLADNATVGVSIRTTDAGTPTLSVDHLNITLRQVGG